MTIEKLRELARRSVAEPIILRLFDGRALRIPHPEFLGIPKVGKSFLFFPETGGTMFVFLTEIVGVDSAARREDG